MSLAALIFDVDGTLADTERDGHRPAFNQAFADFGLDWFWDVELYGELLAVTGGKERIRYFVDNFLTDYRKPGNFEELVVGLHQAKTRHYTALLSNGAIPLRPGVRRLLEEARAAGIRLAIATTTTPDNVVALLRNGLGVDGVSWFEVIAAGDIVPSKKPAPDIYLWALDALKLEPAQCVAIEDSAHGIKASLGAGIPTLITVNGYTADQSFDGALAVLSDLGEPAAPSQVLRGDLNGKPMVDVELLQRWSSHA